MVGVFVCCLFLFWGGGVWDNSLLFSMVFDRLVRISAGWHLVFSILQLIRAQHG